MHRSLHTNQRMDMSTADRNSWMELVSTRCLRKCSIRLRRRGAPMMELTLVRTVPMNTTHKIGISTLA